MKTKKLPKNIELLNINSSLCVNFLNINYLRLSFWCYTFNRWLKCKNMSDWSFVSESRMKKTITEGVIVEVVVVVLDWVGNTTDGIAVAVDEVADGVANANNVEFGAGAIFDACVPAGVAGKENVADGTVAAVVAAGVENEKREVDGVTVAVVVDAAPVNEKPDDN